MRVGFTECNVTVVALVLKQHMARIHEICVQYMRGIKEGGG